MSLGRPPRPPWGRLCGLCGVVLAAHLALLQGAPDNFRPGRPAWPAVFSTRSVAPPQALAMAPSADGRATASATAMAGPMPMADQPPAPQATAAPAHRRPPTRGHRPQPDNRPPEPATASAPAVSQAFDQPVNGLAETAGPNPDELLKTALATPGNSRAGNTSKAAATASPAAVRIPAARRLLYQVAGEAKRIAFGAHAELLWQPEGSSYNARLEIAAMFVGSRVQTSSGQLTPDGLAPLRFGDKVRSEVAAHFERDKGKISFSANTPDVPLQQGAQDRLSVLLQLAALLAGDPQRYPAGSSISMQTIGPRDADDWRFVVGEEETLDLPDGPHRARKLSREPRRDFDLRVDVWLAADLSYLPVQLRMTQQSGDFVQLRLKSVEIP